VAICKTCGKKYSKWTTPVSARGVCGECFEAELGGEREVAPPEDVSPAPMTQETVPERRMDAQLDSTPQSSRAMPVSAKMAATYLITYGILGILFLFSDLEPKFRDKSIEWRAGNYTQQIMLYIASVVAGIAVLRQRPWARKLGVIVLVIATFNGALAAGYGWEGGMPPAWKVLVISFVVVGALTAPWIWLLCRRSRSDAPPKA
jgi:hypothetical protein